VSPRRRLAEYDAKRDFARTPEPAGDGETTAATLGGLPRFVVQRHRARATHYDFRLEMDGVLASWAVPKGPTLDPTIRRLAVHVEDHPVEYVDFEGVIPHGEYGGGDVIVWDRGWWELIDDVDPVEAVAGGELHFDLHGDKLVGRFVLVRTGRGENGGRRRADQREQWLLLHKRDDFAQKGWDPEDHPRSVKSGRTNDEVAAHPDARWYSDRPAAEAEEVEPTVDPDALAALDELGREGEWEVDGEVLRLTNLDKVLFPKAKGSPAFTKRDLIRHYASVARPMLPYLVARPVNTKRFPNGVAERGFWQKKVPAHAPEWVTQWHNDDAAPKETQEYVVVDRVATLVWLANYGVVELHPWTSRVTDAHEPTWAYIDIDPGTATSFDDVVTIARLYHAALDHLGLEGRPKVTGQRGLQIWVPVRPGYTFDDTRDWIEALSRAVAANVPDLVSWEWVKKDRGGKARLDYTQNAIGHTLVAPFSVRGRPGAPVSVPIGWDELDDADLTPDRWTIATIGERLARAGDPLAPLRGLPQELPAVE
jgi:bifunctional non-homologous end joining protein LigD